MRFGLTHTPRLERRFGSGAIAARSQAARGVLTLALAGAFWVRADATAEEAPSPPAGPFTTPALLRPVGGERDPSVCSFREPICVHGPLSRDALSALLGAAERAWEVETGPLALPTPDADLGTGAYDIYVARVLEGAATLSGARDPRSRMDRAAAYTLIDPALADGDECVRDTVVAAAVARASLYRVAPATDEGSAQAEAAYFARLAVPCAIGSIDGVDVFQQNPDRAIADPTAFGAGDPTGNGRYERGASLFYWWLDASYSATPGGLVRAIWALSPTMTPFGAPRWNDEPDGVDVLRETFKDTLASGSRLEDLFAEFGTTRALLGPRDNGAELTEARPLDSALATRLDWTIDWPATPRRFASPVPIAPTGSSYILVHRAGAPPGARLRVEAEWEQHAALRWTVVKLDAKGRELARIPIAASPRATEAQATIVDLDAAADLLVVATNVGDPFVRLDPDDARFEPHGWLVSLAAQ